MDSSTISVLMREALCIAIATEPDLVAIPASNSIEALELARIATPDMILFSLGNPGLGDVEALTALRKSLPDIPILALTSNEAPGQEQFALDAGACMALTKAVSRSELICKLREPANFASDS